MTGFQPSPLLIFAFSSSCAWAKENLVFLQIKMIVREDWSDCVWKKCNWVNGQSWLIDVGDLLIWMLIWKYALKIELKYLYSNIFSLKLNLLEANDHEVDLGIACLLHGNEILEIILENQSDINFLFLILRYLPTQIKLMSRDSSTFLLTISTASPSFMKVWIE